MHKVNLQNQSGSGPSWASRSTGAGFGGFQDLSGIESKTAPGPLFLGIDDSKGGNYSKTAPNQTDLIVQAPVSGIAADMVSKDGVLTQGADGVRSTKQMDQPPAIVQPALKPSAIDPSHSQEFLDRQKMPMGFPPGLFERVAGRINALPNTNGIMPGKSIKQPVIVQPTQKPVATPEPSAKIAPQSANDNKKAVVWKTATATAYNGREKGDTYGSQTAKPNSKGERFAIEGETIAVDPKVIPYGTKLEVMLADGTTRIVRAHDTGSDVVKRTASIARGNNNPVFDFYTEGDPIQANAKIGNSVKYRVLQDSQV